MNEVKMKFVPGQLVTHRYLDMGVGYLRSACIDKQGRSYLVIFADHKQGAWMFEQELKLAPSTKKAPVAKKVKRTRKAGVPKEKVRKTAAKK